MSEKNWSVKVFSGGHRGRHQRAGKEFPRHAMQYFEGSHLSMRKRMWSKSNPGTTYRRGPYLHCKYIIGLLNKYVGKTYEEFKLAFDLKLKKLKGYDLDAYRTLKYYLEDEPREFYHRQTFYIDKEGFIRKNKQIKRKFFRTLPKKLYNYNERVKIPNFGAARQTRHRYFYDNYDYVNEVKRPLLLGEFYLNIDGDYVKLPVYTCCLEMYRDYYNYCKNSYSYSDWNPKLKKYIKSPFWESRYVSWGRDAKMVKKAYNLTQKWKVATVYGMDQKQDFWIRAKNLEYEDLENTLNHDINELKKTTDPLDKSRLEERIEINREKLEKTPKELPYNIGYGQFYTFYKVEDYERVKRKTT